MLPPEIQRIVLLVALAATGYLMILAWTEDMENAKAPVTYEEAPAVTPDNGVAAGSDVPTMTEETASSSDVPDASLIAGEAEAQAETAAPAEANAARLIEVITPSLRVWINPVGGDIERVQLPQYPVELDQPDLPFQLLERSSRHTYIAQSGLLGREHFDSRGRPTYATTDYEVRLTEGQTREVVLTADIGGALVRKVFVFRADDYLVDLRFEVENQSTSPMRGALYAQIKRDDKPPRNVDTFALAPQPYLGAAFTTPEERYRKIDFEDVDDDGDFEESGPGGWVAFLQHYFLSAWVADQDETNNFFAKRNRDGTYMFGFTGPSKTVAPGATEQWNAQFYAGPKDQKRLETIAENLNLTVDYGFLWWVAVPLFYLLDWLYGLVGNWGVAIILLTVVVKVLLYPLSAAGYKSMANMRRVAPAMKKLQERYGNDREKLSKEMMALYKKEGANPLGGCLPMLLPMPIFIALYWVLFESVELRQAPFFLWIEDLAVMDPFFILPLLMGASMYWMQTLNPQVGDPMQVRMMKMMPIMFTVLFLFFPAGLVLYWLVNNVLSIAQQQYVYRQAEKAQAAKA